MMIFVKILAGETAAIYGYSPAFQFKSSREQNIHD